MNIIKTSFFPLIIAIFLITSCGPSRIVSFNVTRPAQITLPSDINTMLLVDRTKFNNKMVNILEGILTGELPEDDRIAAQETMMRLKNKLDYSPRFNVKILPKTGREQYNCCFSGCIAMEHHRQTLCN